MDGCGGDRDSREEGRSGHIDDGVGQSGVRIKQLCSGVVNKRVVQSLYGMSQESNDRREPEMPGNTSSMMLPDQVSEGVVASH